jgi:acetyl esterase/lipase
MFIVLLRCKQIGGGWMTGSKFFAGHAALGRIASRGVVVVSINYRLAPERAFPTQIIDCKRALVYVKRNCIQWGGDAKKVFVCGESAGGHLAALLALTPNLAEYQPPESPIFDTSVAGCVPIYGVMDITDTDGHLAKLHPPIIEGLEGGMRPVWERVIMQKPFKTNLHDYELASPTYHAKRALESLHDPHICPFMIVHGTRDALAAFNDSKTFYDQLQLVRRKFNQPADVFVPVQGG